MTGQRRKTPTYRKQNTKYILKSGTLKYSTYEVISNVNNSSRGHT
jgi:hypothetical protein